MLEPHVPSASRLRTKPASPDLSGIRAELRAALITIALAAAAVFAGTLLVAGIVEDKPAQCAAPRAEEFENWLSCRSATD